MGNSFGTLFRISSWGESHGGGIGVVIDGCPPQLPLCEKDIQPFLDRRRPGQSKLTTPRDEADQVEILSGVFEGKTLGTPIALLVRNKDARPQAYDEMKEKFRPSHADFTYQTKFGHRNHEGGGRSSARETIARVASGAIAQKILSFDGVSISTYVERIHDIEAPKLSNVPTLEEIEASPTRCPHPETASKMEARVLEAKKAGDSVGGSVLCRVNGLPVGWGLRFLTVWKPILPKPCSVYLPPRALKWAVDSREPTSKAPNTMTPLKLWTVGYGHPKIYPVAYREGSPMGRNSTSGLALSPPPLYCRYRRLWTPPVRKPN